MSGLLWDLVQHRCDLLGQFEAVKSYFLLGRGDFYQQFLDEVGPQRLCSWAPLAALPGLPRLLPAPRRRHRRRWLATRSQPRSLCTPS